MDDVGPPLWFRGKAPLVDVGMKSPESEKQNVKLVY